MMNSEQGATLQRTDRPQTSPLENRAILLIEDDPDIAELIKLHFSDQYRRVEIARDGLQGYRLALGSPWDLIILDLRLPGKDGLELCRDLRANADYVPILMLTSKSAELDRVLGLEMGADDYVTKPFSIIELGARIKAILRRVESPRAPAGGGQRLQSTVHGIALDTRLHKVLKRGREIELTAKEFDLLSYFLQHPGSVFSRTQLLNDVWGYGHDGYEHTVNSHINRLRAKIEDNPTRPDVITTVWGVGYKLNEPVVND